MCSRRWVWWLLRMYSGLCITADVSRIEHLLYLRGWSNAEVFPLREQRQHRNVERAFQQGLQSVRPIEKKRWVWRQYCVVNRFGVCIDFALKPTFFLTFRFSLNYLIALKVGQCGRNYLKSLNGTFYESETNICINQPLSLQVTTSTNIVRKLVRFRLRHSNVTTRQTYNLSEVSKTGSDHGKPLEIFRFRCVSWKLPQWQTNRFFVDLSSAFILEKFRSLLPKELSETGWILDKISWNVANYVDCPNLTCD